LIRIIKKRLFILFCIKTINLIKMLRINKHGNSIHRENYLVGDNSLYKIIETVQTTSRKAPTHHYG
jgi:phosphopantetheinyl transferase